MDEINRGQGGDEIHGRVLGGILVGVAACAVLALVLAVAVVLAPVAALETGVGLLGGGGCPLAVGTGGTGGSDAAASAACVNPDGDAVVTLALAMAAHLHPCAAGGGMDTCYDAGFPATVLAYWRRTCPGCAQWRNGNVQCVLFVLAAYGLAGIPPPAAGNAIRFWALYAGRPGWAEIPAAWGPAPARGLPRPGDMMVWYAAHDPDVGHIAIVVRVAPPTATGAGTVWFASANQPQSVIAEPLLADLTVATWSGYQVVGYIRHVGA